MLERIRRYLRKKLVDSFIKSNNSEFLRNMKEINPENYKDYEEWINKEFSIPANTTEEELEDYYKNTALGQSFKEYQLRKKIIRSLPEVSA